jgi:hypothetical protein
MAYLTKTVLAVAAFFGLMLIAPPSTQALPSGAKSLPHSEATVLVRRECIAWERRPDGTLVCTNWAECTNNVC